ncbi:MAG: DnaA/Hda family protein [Gemmatimonadetes bacterium]|nr:DnaA/Hda family protein [Gemmatimonadota bacterium]
MSVHGLDPRYTFDQFVVAPASRLAAAAARRTAEAPGRAYNPLFIYGASGLGKTHLLMAIGNHAARIHADIRILCDTLERVIVSGALAEAAAAEAQPGSRILLLDDAQTVAGDRRAQETLLSWWDALITLGVQVVLAADRPPSEIDPIDQRLLSRMCSGLIADIGPPDYEMRVALVRRRARERGHTLAHGVPEAVARIAFANVRELQGALNRVIAAQELDGRPVGIDELGSLLGVAPKAAENEEFASFFTEISGAVEAIATRATPEQRIVDAIMRFEGEGFRTFRLEQGLRDTASEEAAAELVSRFATDVERLRTIAERLRELDADAPELARTDLLQNPDRVLEAETLLAQARERLQPLPLPGPGPGLDPLGIGDANPALSAARVVASEPGSRFNPLLVIGAAGAGKTTLLTALARQVQHEQPMLPTAFVGAATLGREIESALERGSIEAWHVRYRRARMLVIDDIDDPGAGTDVRRELARLLESIRRSGGQVVLSADRAEVAADDPLREFLSGAVVRSLHIDGRSADGADDEPVERETIDPWFMDREKVLARWPYLEDLLVLEWE